MKKTNTIFVFFIVNRFCFLLTTILFMIFCNSAQAQVEATTKEEIRITSSFKPSIIKKGKVVFFATPPEKDTAAFTFKYELPFINVMTPIRSFTISPLDVERQDLGVDSIGFYGKIGYGNIQNPFAHVAFEDDKVNRRISIWAKHISAKGSMPDQQFANSKIGASVDSKLNDYQKLVFNVGYDLDHYRRYGYNHDRFNFNDSELNQQYNYINTSILFSSLSKDGKSIISPTLFFSNLSSSLKAKENTINLSVPFKKQLTESISLKSSPTMELVFYNKKSDSSALTSLFQLPLTGSFNNKNLNLEAGFNAVLGKSNAKVLPTLDFHFKPLNTNFDLFVQIANKAAVNSLYYLTNQNPYISTPDSLSIFQQVDYGAGIKLIFLKRFSIKLSGGYTSFENLPIYVNTGLSGKDFSVFYKPDLNAVHLKAEIAYSPTSRFDFKANLISYSFTGESKNEKIYGFIPTKLSADLTWKPIRNLKLNSIISFWKGPWAFSESKSNHLLKNVADINLGVDYDLNKKWGIWIDLNNIANVKYERWSQYSSFGFNVVGGVRYQLFNKKRIN